MDMSDELMDWLEFEGGIVGNGTLSDRGVDVQVNENLGKDQIEEMHMALNRVEHQIADSFEKKADLMWNITLQAKLRLLIMNRMKGVKKIPREYFDKYNDVVTEMRFIIKEQIDKEKRNSGQDEEQ